MIIINEYNGNIPPTRLSDYSRANFDIFLDFMSDRNLKPNGFLMIGSWHSIGIIMATRSYSEGKKCIGIERIGK